ncbi:MAG: hypothetical protein IT323_08890 [Anaerolineae bacterium]|nr:hypothetical protein [Anaerolineae bacterium]
MNVEQLRQRLQELKAEFEQGTARLSELDRQRADLRDGLLRIAGAIQILEELLQQGEGGSPPSPASPDVRT